MSPLLLWLLFCGYLMCVTYLAEGSCRGIVRNRIYCLRVVTRREWCVLSDMVYIVVCGPLQCRLGTLEKQGMGVSAICLA
jgi:hypothetical protein